MSGRTRPRTWTPRAKKAAGDSAVDFALDPARPRGQTLAASSDRGLLAAGCQRRRVDRSSVLRVAGVRPAENRFEQRPPSKVPDRVPLLRREMHRSGERIGGGHRHIDYKEIRPKARFRNSSSKRVVLHAPCGLNTVTRHLRQEPPAPSFLAILAVTIPHRFADTLSSVRQRCFRSLPRRAVDASCPQAVRTAVKRCHSLPRMRLFCRRRDNL